jgi:tetratricopeptide (TPR) repeat protein
MSDEQKPKTPLAELGALVKNVNELAATIAAIIAAITFAATNRIVSYVFILIACVSVSWFLWRVIRRRAIAIPLILIIAAASLGWVGVHAQEDYEKWVAEQGKKPSTILPAKPGELLVILCEFERGKTNEYYDVVGRVREPLARAVKDAGIPNVRIEATQAVTTSVKALELGQKHQAVFVIWGEYDSAGFRPHFTVARESKQRLQKTELKEIPTELREFKLFIREGLPAQMNYLATFTVGQLYYWDGKYDDALRAFDIALANLEQSRRVEGVPLPEGLSALYFYRGYIQDAVKGNVDQAIADYTRSIELNPQSAETYFNRGFVYHTKNNLDQAIADYTRAAELDPKYDLARFALAVGYANRGLSYAEKDDLDRAIADCDKAIEIDPKVAVAYKVRAYAYKEKGDWDRAIADYTKAIELDPKDASNYYYRGRAYSSKDNLDQAIADYSRAIELNPKDAFAYYYRASAQRKKGNLDQAIADYTTALELDPKDGMSYFARGNVYLDKGDYDRAIADYTKTIELDAKDASAYFNRALAQRKKGNLDQALDDYSKAIELDPKYANAYYNRGLLYREKSMKPQAIADFEMYLQLIPNASDRAKVEQWIRELKGQ